jgi:hypothetical protein
MVPEVRVELFLTNTGSSEIEATEKGFGTGVTYFALYDTAKRTFRGEVWNVVGDWLPALNQTELRKLSRGQSIRTAMTIPLPKGLFDRVGFYRLQVRYSGHVKGPVGKEQPVELSSNWTIFEMKKCEGPEGHL